MERANANGAPASATAAAGMGRARRPTAPRRERWLLTRKTWRYMADAGRRLIPEGALDRAEDVPKIEAFFQEVCAREPRFLLWRKCSYPGAAPIRPRRHRARGGSARTRTPSTESAPAIAAPARPGSLVVTHTSGGRFDIAKLKRDFLAGPSEARPTVVDDKTQLADMLQKYLTLRESPQSVNPGFDYKDLVDKLRHHLSRTLERQSAARVPSPPTQQIADSFQLSILDTLSRYYSRSPNRDHVIQDLLTDRKILKKLYSDLRKTRGYRGFGGVSSGTGPDWRGRLKPWRREDEDEYDENFDDYSEGSWFRARGPSSPPPLIEVDSDPELRTCDVETQTDRVLNSQLVLLERRYREEQNAADAANAAAQQGNEPKSPDRKNTPRRRSSVDHDDVSQSVSDTIKRYLRMARKKSVDADKADRFKRINYDKNLRNVKGKGEPSVSEDEGFCKSSQTDYEWMLTYRELRFDELPATSPPSPSSPTSPSQGQSFLQTLLGRSAPVVVPSAGAMQKSRSSGNVVQNVSKRIWRTRSRSSSRTPAPAPFLSPGAVSPHEWTPQGVNGWTDGTGRAVTLTDTSLLTLSEVERRALRHAALARLTQFNLGVQIKLPNDSISAEVPKPKRRAYLLKRKALTTGFFDQGRTKDGDKDKDSGGGGGLVFGVPLGQCVASERALRRQNHHGSRASVSSLLTTLDRTDDSGSCDSLSSRERLAGSVPGQLDRLGVSQSALAAASASASAPAPEDEPGPRVPALVAACLDHLRRHGLSTLGLFRVSSSKKRVRQLREDWDRGRDTGLEAETCPHDVATLLKEFLRDLPDPLLCRDLYHAFLQTQNIRNRRLQWEAVKLLVQLLPAAHRDTLSALLAFLAQVAENAEDHTDENGEHVTGNKMDSTNLATVFAPNILHCIKPGSASKEISAEQLSERADVINVIRLLIEKQASLWTLPADILHEAYIHLAHTEPLQLDRLLAEKTGPMDSPVDRLGPGYPERDADGVLSGGTVIGTVEFGDNIAATERRVWSREQCLHEAAGTGGPDVEMRIRQRDREKSRETKKRWRDEGRSDSPGTNARHREDSGSSSASLSSAMTILTSRFRSSQHDDYGSSGIVSSVISKSSLTSGAKASRSDSIDSVSDNNEMGMSSRRLSSPLSDTECAVITASLRIPAAAASAAAAPGSPAAERAAAVASARALALDDADIPFIEEDARIGRHPTAPPRRRQRSTSSDSSLASQPVTGTLSLGQAPTGYDSAVGSSATLSSPPRNATPSSNEGLFSSPPSWASTPPASPTSPPPHYETETIHHSSVSIPVKATIRDGAQPMLQKVTITSAGEIHQKRLDTQKKDTPASKLSTARVAELPKSHSTSAVSSPTQKSVGFSISKPADKQEKESKYVPSITNIGGAVLRSKTADFERLLHGSRPDTGRGLVDSRASAVFASDDKKKYSKRRYTDSRHQTRHIPDAESLESGKSSPGYHEGVGGTSVKSVQVYKRGELISSVQSKNK